VNLVVAYVRAEAYLDGCVLRTKQPKNVRETKAPQSVVPSSTPDSGSELYRDELVQLSAPKEAF
jgi:hypothetical protein